jgi:glycosyltransferase involved in cell wall biosynthesis
LSRLEQQETQGIFDYSIVIADNDRSESARGVVESHAWQSKISISYNVEPEQNIALARNKAVENAKGDFLGFIDDDEFPLDEWLLTLYKALKCFESDGVLGPVMPYFEKEPPGWVMEGGLFERPTHRTGHRLEWNDTRTGNVLLRRELFKEDRFNPIFGSGGEDRDFFGRKIEEGHVFVWCDEAPVFEAVQPERWSRKVLLEKALLRGKMALYATRSKPQSVFKSVLAVGIYAGCLPLAFVLGHHVFMKYLIKSCDHFGKILAFLGIDCVKQKYVVG